MAARGCARVAGHDSPAKLSEMLKLLLMHNREMDALILAIRTADFANNNRYILYNNITMCTLNVFVDITVLRKGGSVIGDEKKKNEKKECANSHEKNFTTHKHIYSFAHDHTQAHARIIVE